MPTREDIIQEVIYPAIDEIVVGIKPNARMDKRPSMILVGPKAVLDSLGLVTLIAGVEALLQERYAVTLTLVTEETLSLKHSPFRTLALFAEYIQDRMDQASRKKPA